MDRKISNIQVIIANQYQKEWFFENLGLIMVIWVKIVTISKNK